MNLNKYFLRNKKNNIMFIVLIICLNFIVCCKSSNNNVLIKTYSFYKQAQKKLKEKKFNDAILMLETIKKNKIANFIDDKIYINLIYAYYNTSDLNMAQKTLEKFMHIYPNHPNIDYVIYMQSLIKISMDKNIFFTYFPINYNKNDTYYAQSAFFELKYLINQYPKSLYVVNAKKHLIALKYRLSEHDFKILKFYFLNKEYIAVVNRGEEILQKYPETPAARKALIYIEKSYFALKIFDTAQKISKIISLNEI